MIFHYSQPDGETGTPARERALIGVSRAQLNALQEGVKELRERGCTGRAYNMRWLDHCLRVLGKEFVTYARKVDKDVALLIPEGEEAPQFALHWAPGVD